MNAFKQMPTTLKVVFVTLALLLIVSVASVGVLARKIKLLENPSLANNAELQSIIREVSKVLVLPTNETPTLATVADPAQLKGQAFFAQAETGDKVLIYSVSRRAVLWRPSVSKVVEVSGLNNVPPVQ